MSSTSIQPLPDSWVDGIFNQMLAAYGTQWVRMWEGVEVPVVKAQWARELAGVKGWAIQHALEHLPPDRPPNSLQFKVIAISAPSPDPAPQLPGMPAPKADITRLRAALEKLRAAWKGREERPKQWALDLQKRDRAGERLTEGQIKAYREALSTTGPADRKPLGDFQMIDPRVLPPGMRAQMIDDINREI